MKDLVLGESLELLLDHRGKTPTKLGASFESTGVPVASAIMVSGGRLDLSRARFVSPETWARWMKEPTRKDDVLLTSEAPLGRVARVTSDDPLVLGQRLFGLRGKEGVLNSRFLFYALQERRVVEDLIARSTGTTVTGIRQSALKKVVIRAPEHSEQVRVAELLGALDDKVAANAELARTADDLASGLFTRSVAGATSGVETFGAVCTVGGGGTPRSGDPALWSGDIAWTTPTDVTRLSGPYLRSTARTITEYGLASCASPLYPVNSILMTSRATIGSFALAKIPTAVNQGFIVVNPLDDRLRYWIFHDMRSRVDEFKSFANGATFLELSRGTFKKLLVRLASEEAMTEFCVRAAKLHDLANQVLIESEALATLRDTLLPHLMSGRLTVRDAERTVSDAV